MCGCVGVWGGGGGGEGEGEGEGELNVYFSHPGYTASYILYLVMH